MTIGNLDRRITVEEKTLSQDATGQETESWSDKWTLWAQIADTFGGQTGKEVYEADKETAIRQLIFRIRYKSAINATDHRIKYDGKIYDILEVKEDLEQSRKQYMKIICDAR